MILSHQPKVVVSIDPSESLLGYEIFTETFKEVSGTLPSGGYTTHTKSRTTGVPRTKVFWKISVSQKTSQPTPGPKGTPSPESEITVQLTADQQVNLSISGQDKYGNPVDISGDVSWVSSDESVVVLKQGKSSKGSANAVALAVGPVGTAAVTVTNDHNSDEEIDFQGSIAIDVVAGDISEIVVNQGAITNKGEPPVIDNTLPGQPPVVDNTLPDQPPVVDNTLPEQPPVVDNTLPGDQPVIDNSLPGDQPGIDNSLPGDQPGIDNSLPGDQPVIDNSLPVQQPTRPPAVPGR